MVGLGVLGKQIHRKAWRSGFIFFGRLTSLNKGNLGVTIKNQTCIELSACSVPDTAHTHTHTHTHTQKHRIPFIHNSEREPLFYRYNSERERDLSKVTHPLFIGSHLLVHWHDHVMKGPSW